MASFSGINNHSSNPPALVSRNVSDARSSIMPAESSILPPIQMKYSGRRHSWSAGHSLSKPITSKKRQHSLVLLQQETREASHSQDSRGLLREGVVSFYRHVDGEERVNMHFVSPTIAAIPIKRSVWQRISAIFRAMCLKIRNFFAECCGRKRTTSDSPSVDRSHRSPSERSSGDPCARWWKKFTTWLRVVTSRVSQPHMLDEETAAMLLQRSDEELDSLLSSSGVLLEATGGDLEQLSIVSESAMNRVYMHYEHNAV